MSNHRNDETPATPDSYAAQYMDGAQARIATRKPMPWWFFALIAVAGLVSVVPAVASGSYVGLVMLPLLAATALLLSHLRLTVTATRIHVQLGLFGPKIPIRQVVKVTAEDYQPVMYGGWGIRYSLRDKSWAYSIPGGNGRGVRIVYRDDKGGAHTVFVSSNEADAVATAITDARVALAGTAVRVDADEAMEAAEAEDGARRAGDGQAGKAGTRSRD